MSLSGRSLTVESFRKQDSPRYQSDENVSKRQLAVDSLIENKEKSLLFNKINYEPDNFFRFGAPGAGAPLRNANQSHRKTDFNDNLWGRYAENNNSYANSLNVGGPYTSKPLSKTSQLSKRQEMLNLIDNYTYRRNTDTRLYDPVTRTHIRPENYWNDWFGKPGAGAPTWTNHRQSLDKMLEPVGPLNNIPPRVYDYSNSIDRSHTHASLSSSYNPCDPNSFRPAPSVRPFRSNHHNFYEVPQPQRR